MNKFIKIFSILLITCIVCVSCSEKQEDAPLNHEVKQLYERNTNVLGVEYEGLNLDGLKMVKENSDISLGSITFSEYDNGDIACIKNSDLKEKEYCAYEMIVRKGENVVYPFWAITYSDDCDKYFESLENGIDNDFYNMLPFTASDAMSFGYTKDGDRSSLFISKINRYEPIDSTGEINLASSGTYPNATYKSGGVSLPSLVAGNCISVDEALAFIGAVDEYGNMLYSSITPLLNYASSSFEKDGEEYVVIDAFALEDSSGRHGIVEFINNKPIWYEGLDYSFNFILKHDYLLNDDETYKEKYGKGIGRMEKVLSKFSNIKTMEDHFKLMNDIECSIDDNSANIDWRSEFTGYDVFLNYDKYVSLNLPVEKADELYPLYAHYYDSENDIIVLIDSYDTWLEKKDHLENIYDMNYCLNELNKNELTNLINWFSIFSSKLSESDKVILDNFYSTYIKIAADPMNYRVTRFFDEEITTADTIFFDDICDYKFVKEEEK